MLLPVNERDHVIGPRDAAITVINYGDYECSDCHSRHRAVQKVVDELTSSVRFVYRHFPLLRAHSRALQSAEAAEAAAAQDKFWEMHRRLYDRPDKLEIKDLRRHAEAIGLDMKRFDQEMESGLHKDQILKDYYTSINCGISGAPTTFINGELFAMSGVELLTVVKANLQQQRS